MQLTLHTDYSLRTLIYVALKPEGELSTVSEVAEVFNIPRNHLVKVVHRLGQEGFLQTVRGKNGGIALARHASQINIGEVVRRMEPTMDPVDCHKPLERCRLLPGCRLKQALLEASKAFLSVLDGYTLADLIEDSPSIVRLLGIQLPELRH